MDQEALSKLSVEELKRRLEEAKKVESKKPKLFKEFEGKVPEIDFKPDVKQKEGMFKKFTGTIITEVKPQYVIKHPRYAR